LSADEPAVGAWFAKHPWLTAGAALLFVLGNVYEALYVRPNTLMSYVDWALAVAGFLVFAGILLNNISEYFSKSED
jgi:uncharacterized membrane protein YoaK (UPF0700 family)